MTKLTTEEKKRRQIERNKKKWNETHKIINGEDHKVCTACMDWFPCKQEYFYKKVTNNLDGFDTYCKVCAIKKSRNRHLENHEEYLKYSKKWCDENLEKNHARIKEWYWENKEHKNKKTKEWQQNNPDKLKVYANRRIKKKHDITPKEKQLCKEYFNYSCAYCNLTEDEHKEMYKQQLHMDHVDPDGANDLSNNIPSCRICNITKRDYSLEYFFSVKDVSKENKDKIIKWLDEDYKQSITH